MTRRLYRVHRMQVFCMSISSLLSVFFCSYFKKTKRIILLSSLPVPKCSYVPFGPMFTLKGGFPFIKCAGFVVVVVVVVTIVMLVVVVVVAADLFHVIVLPICSLIWCYILEPYCS